jgi:autotransporter-associated beta strand protein
MPTNDANPTQDTTVSFLYTVPSNVLTANLLPITTPVVLGGAAGSTPTLDLQGANQQVASLADVVGADVKGVVTNSATATPVVLTLGATEGETTYSGSIDGNLSLVKSGASIQNLTGTLTYTGDTKVNAGTLNASSINTPLAKVSVADGATLTATSIVANTLTIGGPASAAAPVATVPEPGTLVMLALAVLGLAGMARRKK